MENILIGMQQFVKQSLHPQILSGRNINANELKQWRKFIEDQLNRLSVQTTRSLFSSRNECEHYILTLIEQLTFLSNTINEYLTKFNNAWKSNSQAPELKKSYQWTCQAFQNFIDDLQKKFPSILGKATLTHYGSANIRRAIKAKTNELEKHLLAQQISSSIVQVIKSCFYQAAHSEQLTQDYVIYLQKVSDLVLGRPFSDTQKLIDFLIVNDFNMPEFFLFCVENWNDQLSNKDGLEDQRDLLLDLKTHLYDISLLRGLKNPSVKRRLYNELNAFLTEKYSLVKERLKINRLLSKEEQSASPKRVLINLPVAQLGLFIRLQIEKGLLAKEHISDLFSFFARHFYTPNTNYISAESLRKKSTVVEHATARKLKAVLISMLNWLNTNYNLSNFN